MEKWLERRFRLAGRATRREFAVTMLLFCVLFLFLDSIGQSDGFGDSLAAVIISVVIISVVFWIPIAVMVRRLHDIGLSGWWWWLMVCMPFAQIGILLLFFVGPDRFSQTRLYANPRRSSIRPA
ncbi:DUF805 domain-containing protein [Burkholderia sp. Ax-1719]|jgi:uncharacterized membrane protein YhaH (DUF805 family)|uniref:DUF805 domain-containing protein n=1 Tax=Burkholderia sp. Ax-1719 TaxID=2608334 RepID=UPI00141F4B6C|nr:DUF805 domain-containing protein [Burkholderia sp. Ax-1719]